MRRAYISGPMTGLPDSNFPAFNAAAAELRALGVDVVNPAEHGLPLGLEWSEYMRADIRAMMDCNRIHMLPGWCRSPGARMEHYIAYELGFEITGAAE